MSANDDNETQDRETVDGGGNAVPAIIRVRSPARSIIKDRYELVSLLGEGGMGEVHRARDVRTSRDVALKLAHSRESSKQQRFEQEMRVQAQLEHPAIVAVYDGSTRDDVGAFFTMRIVEGTTLDDTIATLRVDPAAPDHGESRRKLLDAFAKVCLAIEFAHSRGVLHRDIKPSNVMLGAFGEVYVLDWGLAQPFASASSSSSPNDADADADADDDHSDPDASQHDVAASPRMTEPGLVMGTYGYMSPEQLRGDVELDARADVFALGALLFELLALEPLLDQEQARRLGRERIVFDARASRRRSRTTTTTPIPFELDDICLRATAYDRRNRFASARELHDALESFLGAEEDLADRTRLADKHREQARAAFAATRSRQRVRIAEDSRGDNITNQHEQADRSVRRGKAAAMFITNQHEQADRSEAEGGVRRGKAAAMFITNQDEQAGRVKALGELGRALALAPDNVESHQLLVDIVRNRPKELPAEVSRELVATQFARVRSMQLTAAATYTIAWITIFPMMVVWAGYERLLDTIIVPAAWIFASVVTVALYKYRVYDTRINIGHAAVMFAVAATSLLTGPHFMVPPIAAAIVMGYMLVATRRQRPIVVALSCLAIGVPALLAWTGVHPVHTFVAEGMVVRAAVVASPSVFYAGLTITDLIAILLAGVAAIRFRNVLEVGVQRRSVFAWQLSNLVPRSGDSASDIPTATTVRRQRSAGVGLSTKEGDTRSRTSSPDASHTGDRYTLIERVKSSSSPTNGNENGKEETWRCHDRSLGRDVAMSILSDDDGGDDARQIFLARALTNAALEHPAIVPIYDIGDIGDNAQKRPFFTSKLAVDDKALSVVLTDRSASQRTMHSLLGAMSQACLAVAYAHSRGVTHGKIDASAIVLGAFGEVYVMGWGATPKPTAAASDNLVDVRDLARVLGEILETESHVSPELAAITPAASSARSLHDAIEAFLSGQRDSALRERLAATHLERARALTSTTTTAPSTSRVDALREIGRAIALTHDPEAMRVLLSLLTTPPSSLPPEVVASLERERRIRTARTARFAAIFGVFWLVLSLAIAFFLGVHNVIGCVLNLVAWVGFEAALVVNALYKVTRTPWPMIAMMVATSMSCVFTGAFLIVPTLATISTMAFVLTVPPGWQKPTIALACLSVLVPTALQVTGIFPIYELTGNLIAVHGALSPTPSQAFLSVTGVHIIALLFGAEYTSRLRDVLDAVDTENLLGTWHISKLVQGPSSEKSSNDNKNKTAT